MFGKKKPISFSIQMSKETGERLDMMREVMGYADNAEVIRDALRCFDYIMEKAIIDGREICLRHKDGTVEPLDIFEEVS